MKREKRIRHIMAILYAGLVYLFLFLPIAVVVAYSFNAGNSNLHFEGFSLRWYGEMFQNEVLMSAFQNTMIVALISTIIATILGTLCAVGLQRFEFKLKKVVSSTLYIPVVIPELVFGIAMLILFSMIHVPMNLFTLIVSHVTFSLPFVVITVRSRLSGMDASIEEAARDLGANEIHTFFRVTLPMAAPGVIAGAILALTLSLDDVVVSFFTAGPQSQTLPLRILGMVKKGVSSDVNALSTLMIIGTIVFMTITLLIQRKLETSEKSETKR